MKVETSRSVRTQGRPSTAKTAAPNGDFAKAMDTASAPGSAAGLSGTGAVGGINALLSLQTVDSATDRDDRARDRARGILDELEELRLDLLTGHVSADRLQHIVRLLSRPRDHVHDRRLSELLDDVDLRAQVELAKLGVDMAAAAR
ncbi:MAG: flagellar assembly protein FliX [Pseudomonadota bacterium]